MALAEDIPEIDEEEAAPQIPPEQFLQAVVSLDNIADMLEPGKLGLIASEALEEYRLDKSSMKDWLDRMQKGIDLAKLVKEARNYPFDKPANVKYPLVTTAALQFNAKAYPAIVPGDAIVKAKVFGNDPQGAKAARGERVCEHMSYQLTCKVDEWEEDTDKLLTLLPIVGTVIRKVWYDPAQQRIRVRLLTTGSFIVNDKVRVLGEAPRLTEELSLYPSEIEERKKSGLFREIDYIGDDAQDKDAPQKFIEQHRRLDLDGDGYAEPYIVTVHCDSQAVARIVADFEMRDVTFGEAEPVTGSGGMPMLDPMTGQPLTQPGKVMAIRRGSYFVAYHMLPSLDGGFWGTGFGLLLGDISETINSVINLMLDAGHMASRGGGFIGSEFRIKGGKQQFQPGEWRMTTAAGSAIKDAIVPLTFPGPDATLFQLLGLLIEAGKEVASIKDILMGESGGKTMTATTTMALIEQGMAQFTAAYKRIFRALRHEYKLIARINAETVSPEEYNAFHDLVGPDGQPVMLDPRQEYDLSDMDIIPVADPGSVTKMQKIAKAQLLMEAAGNGMVDPGAASARMLEAAGVEDIEELTPKPNPMQEEMATKQVEHLQAQIDLLRAQAAEKMRPEIGEDPMAARMQAHADMVKAQAEAEEAPLKAAETAAKVGLVHAQTDLTRAKIGETHRQGALAQAQAETDMALKARGEQRADLGFEREGEQAEAARRRADAESRAKVRTMKS